MAAPCNHHTGHPVGPGTAMIESEYSQRMLLVVGCFLAACSRPMALRLRSQVLSSSFRILDASGPLGRSSCKSKAEELDCNASQDWAGGGKYCTCTKLQCNVLMMYPAMSCKWPLKAVKGCVTPHICMKTGGRFWARIVCHYSGAVCNAMVDRASDLGSARE